MEVSRQTPTRLSMRDDESLTVEPRFGFLKSAVRRWKLIVIVTAPIVLSPIFIAYNYTEYRAAYVIALMVVYWLTEAFPLAVTAILPVLLYPLLGVASSMELSPTYMKEVMMLTVASLMLGVAMEVHNVHKRIALKMLLFIGTGPKRLLLGFLLTGAVLSMLTTNCATATMMVPVAKALLRELATSSTDQNYSCLRDGPVLNGRKASDAKETESNEKAMTGNEEEADRPLYLGCLLAVAYGTSIGGTGTLTGGAPNLLLKAFMDEKYPDYKYLTFSSWTLYNLPAMAISILAAWAVLFCVYVRKSKGNRATNGRVRDYIMEEYRDLGPIRPSEKSLGVLFLILMLLWFFRSPGFVTGWADLFPWGKMIGNAAPAVLVAVLLFAVPSSLDPRSSSLLDWKTAQERTPWGVLLLLGGGLALAHGAQKSGLMSSVSSSLNELRSLSPSLMVVTLSLVTLVTTEFISNTSTASLFIPVIDHLASTLGVHPMFLLMPVTVCCSYAFMLPMATSPNAIVYQNSSMKTTDMAFPGFFLNVLCCMIQVGAIYCLGGAIFALDEPINAIDIKTFNSTLYF